MASIVPNLSRRSEEVELMDRPDTSNDMLVRTLSQFRTINKFLSPHKRLLRQYIIADMIKEKKKRWRLLDLGAGGCDIDLWMLKTCRSKGIKLEITCIDHDLRVVNYAKARTKGIDGIHVICADAARIDHLGGCYDYVFANHFLHHISSENIKVILNNIITVCDRIFLINDIVRCYCSYLSYTLIGGAFFRHSFAYTDGKISIRKGFTRKELWKILCEAKLDAEVLVKTAFPGHVYIVGHRIS